MAGQTAPLGEGGLAPLGAWLKRELMPLRRALLAREVVAARGLLDSARLVEWWPWLTWRVPAPSAWVLAAYYAVLGLCAWITHAPLICGLYCMSTLTPQWYIKVATALFALVTLLGIDAQS